MTRLKHFLLALALFTAGYVMGGAPYIRLQMDSIKFDGHTVYSDSAEIGKNDNTLRVYCRLYNDSLPQLVLNDSFFFFNVTNNGVLLSDTNFTYTLSGDTLAMGGSTSITFGLLNPDNRPIPDLLPGGSSVVIWPLAAYLTDSAHFILYYDSNLSGINNLPALYNFIGYNRQAIYIQFSNAAQRTVELYDATGRIVYQSNGNTTDEEIAWGALPAAVYILRMQQGQQSVSVKLLHY